MPKFHSTVSRREFMKALGLVGAGIGGASVAAPVFHDLDELASSGTDVNHEPWWVKTRDDDGTTPIDWNAVTRYDQTIRPNRSTFATDEEAGILIDYAKKEFPNWEPGAHAMGDLRWDALNSGAGVLAFGVMKDKNGALMNFHSLLGRPSPIVYFPPPPGTPPWQGTPEENLQLVRSAIRVYGGSDVGCLKITEQTRKLFWSKYSPGVTCNQGTVGFTSTMWQDGINKPVDISFEDADQAHFTDTKLVVPNKCESVLVWTLRQGEDLLRRQAGVAEGASVFHAYSQLAIIENRIQVFLKVLGYQGLGGGTSEWGPSGAFGNLAGIGELARVSYINTPKYGITLRGVMRMPTDMPLAPTKPIDAGMREFCKTCGICADLCPMGALEKGDPTWEGSKPFMNKGYESWRCDYDKCPHCPVCQGTCPFNSIPNGSFIHEIVKPTVATAPLFNTFFRNMHKSFEYGRKFENDFWSFESPTYNIDTTR